MEWGTKGGEVFKMSTLMPSQNRRTQNLSSVIPKAKDNFRKIPVTSKQQSNLHHFHYFMIGRKGSKLIKICKLLQISLFQSKLLRQGQSQS